VRYSVLTPNMKGLEAALATRPDEVVVFAAATEAFSQRNINCSVAESIERFRPVVAAAHGRREGARRVSCALGCPYQGEVSADEVERGALMRHRRRPCAALPTPSAPARRVRAQAVLERALKHYPLAEVSGHFHDTYGQALANILACLEMGVAPSTPASPAWAAAPTPRAPPATWPPRTWSSCCTAWASPPGSTWTRWSTPVPTSQRRAGPAAGVARGRALLARRGNGGGQGAEGQ
jgi:hypothetical protein